MAHRLSLYPWLNWAMARITNSDEKEYFEERAAIGEFDGGWPRPIAEAEAQRALDHHRWQIGVTFVNRWLETTETASQDQSIATCPEAT